MGARCQRCATKSFTFKWLQHCSEGVGALDCRFKLPGYCYFLKVLVSGPVNDNCSMADCCQGVQLSQAYFLQIL